MEGVEGVEGVEGAATPSHIYLTISHLAGAWAGGATTSPAPDELGLLPRAQSRATRSRACSSEGEAGASELWNHCHSHRSLLQRAVRAEEAARAGRQSGAAGDLAEQRGCDEADDHQVGDALGRTDQAKGASWQPAPVSVAAPHAWVCSL